VTTGNLNFTEAAQGLFGLGGLLVQPLDSNNDPVGPALDVPPLLSVFLAFRLANVMSVNRDAAGDVVISVNLGGLPFNLDYSSAGQLTAASVFAFPIPTSLI
jgi:hypothetical protein